MRFNPAKALVLLALGVLFSASIFAPSARNYYVSSQGTGNGATETTPMSSDSLKRSFPLIVGNDQILFKCGDTIRDSFNLGKIPFRSVEDVTISSYGAGNRPIISGAKQITGWTLYQNGIYKATFSEQVAHLIVNGKIQTIARFPNRGYDSITAATDKSGFSGFRLNQAGASLGGATVHFRIQNDVIDRGVIGSINGSTATLSTQPGYQIKVNNGYYIDNKLSLLDSAGEWVQEGNTVYCKPPAGVTLSSVAVEGMVLNIGFRGPSVQHFIIRGLSVQGFVEAGAYFNPASNYGFYSCEFRNIGANGIRFGGGGERNITIDSCSFYDIFNNAVRGEDSRLKNFLMKNCLVKRIALVPGYETPIMIGGQGVSANVDSSRFEGNIVDSIGYGGLNGCGAYNTYLHNIISNTGMSKNDCGPFQTWGGNDLITNHILFKENICFNSWGNSEGLGGHSELINSEGIYFDDGVDNSTIEGNTVWGCISGIFIQSSRNFVVRDNVCYNNVWNQFFMNEKNYVELNIPNYKMLNIVAKKNVFYSISRPWVPQSVRYLGNFGICVRVQNGSDQRPIDYYSGDSNYVFNPYSDTLFNITSGGSDTLLTMAQMKTRGGEANGKKWFLPKVTFTSEADAKNRSRLFVNMSGTVQTVSLSGGYSDLDGNPVTGSIVLQPYRSRVLIQGTVGVQKNPAAHTSSPAMLARVHGRSIAIAAGINARSQISNLSGRMLESTNRGYVGAGVYVVRIARDGSSVVQPVLVK